MPRLIPPSSSWKAATSVVTKNFHNRNNLGITSASTSHHNNMKFPRTFSVAAAAACSLGTTITTVVVFPLQSHAWVVAPVRPSSSSSSASLSGKIGARFLSTSSSSSSSALRSTLMAAEEEALSTTTTTADSSTVIAEGTVVAKFPGGLTAVRLHDDIISTTTTSASSTSATSSSSSTPSGASGDLQGKRVVFSNDADVQGCVVAHRPPVVFVYNPVSSSTSSSSSSSTDVVDGGGKFQILDSMATVQVSPSETFIDHDSFSSNMDDGGRTTTVQQQQQQQQQRLPRRAIFAPIPQVKDIALINSPMLTGVTMMDALAPMGRGQNMLWIGHDLEQLRGYSMDFLKTQIREANSKERTKCIYASTLLDRDQVLRRFKALGISEQDVHIVAPSPTDMINMDEASQAARAVTICGAACAAGELYALEQGLNALVVIDTMDLHKKLWDVTTRVLVDVYGVDAVVQGDRDGGASSEMRAFYSCLIQRAGQYKPNRGGGSVSLLLLTQIPLVDSDDQVFDSSVFDQAPEKVKDRIKLLVQRMIPLTAENLRKIGIPVPTEGDRRFALQHVDELISMSDGQIWLDERLEAIGQVLPPMDPQRSVTRIGIGADTQSRADAPALRRITERLRLDLSQASNLDGADIQDKAIQKQLQRKDALLLAMYQPPGSGGRRLSESCVALLAAQEGFLDNTDAGSLVGTEAGEKLIQGLLDHVLREAAAAMTQVDESLDLSPGARKELTRAVESYFVAER